MIEPTVKRRSRVCSVCGDPGHNCNFHTSITDSPKICSVCKELKLPEQFRVNKYTAKKANTGPRITVCLRCESDKDKSRYRNDFYRRLDCLTSNARARTRAGSAPPGIDIDAIFLMQLYNKQNGLCYFTNKPLTLESGRNGISLDRKDPLLGYTKSNVVLSRWVINEMRRNLSESEFIEECRLVARTHKK